MLSMIGSCFRWTNALLWQKNASDTEFFVTSFIPFWLRGDLIAFQQQDVGIIDLTNLNGSEYVRAKTTQRTPKKVQTNALFQINYFSLYQKKCVFSYHTACNPPPKKKLKFCQWLGLGNLSSKNNILIIFPIAKVLYTAVKSDEIGIKCIDWTRNFKVTFTTLIEHILQKRCWKKLKEHLPTQPMTCQQNTHLITHISYRFTKKQVTPKKITPFIQRPSCQFCWWPFWDGENVTL